LWSNDIGKLGGEHVSPASLEDWEKVPPTYAEICTWAQIARDPTATERRRENIVIYCNPPATDTLTLFPISIRVQGYLDAFCLRTLGNWNGYRSSPISQSFQKGTNFPVFVDLLITCSCSQRASDSPVTTLSIADDPKQLYSSIAQQWCLTDRLLIGRRTDNGGRSACSHLMLSPGDFVDVGLTFDIVHQREKDGSQAFKIHLGFSHVLQIASAENLNKACVRHINFLFLN
ncbi:hypothetical protein BJ138DRAFT_1017715, partial [Hygrophoropsis aurantiaca]